MALFTKWDKKIRISLFVLSLITALISASITFYTTLNPTCYDRYGNEYDSESEVIYYTEDNKKYTFDRETYYFIDVDNSKNKMKEDDIYLDENGYLVNMPKESIELDENTDYEDPYDFYDSSGKRYALVGITKWDSEGNLCTK